GALDVVERFALHAAGAVNAEADVEGRAASQLLPAGLEYDEGVVAGDFRRVGVAVPGEAFDFEGLRGHPDDGAPRIEPRRNAGPTQLCLCPGRNGGLDAARCRRSRLSHDLRAVFHASLLTTRVPAGLSIHLECG